MSHHKENLPQTVSEDSRNVNLDMEDPQLRSVVTFDDHQPWGWSQRTSPETSARFARRVGHNNLSKEGKKGIRSPDRLLSFSFVKSSGDKFYRSTIQMPSSLPSWLWCFLSFTLGVRQDEPISRSHKAVSSFLRILTLISALCFGFCGLLLHVYEMVHEFTNTTALICIFKTVVGMFWILLGIYSHSLATRSFSSKAFLDFIRLHSKTFMKISTAAWISLLCVAVVGANFYDNVYLLENKVFNNETTEADLIESTCAKAKLPAWICEVYYFSKVVFSCLNLVWILLVVGICLSMCRTHAICIRRFMTELTYDAKIFEEFTMLKMSQEQPPEEQIHEELNECDISQDFSSSLAVESESSSNRKNIWKSLRKLRHSVSSSTYSSMVSDANVISSSTDDQLRPHQENSSNHNKELKVTEDKKEIIKSKEKKKEREQTTDTIVDFTDKGKEMDLSVDEGDIRLIPHMSKMKAPIMSNEDLMFTYFKIVKNLSGTSRLLQRWMSSSIIFVMLWCGLMVIFWSSHAADFDDLCQFLIPLIVLGLLISGYAEVNYEGYLLVKYILPTEERMSAIYYVNNRHLELKVYNFNMTYNILATFVLGTALTLATKIILEKVF